jgi:hypothetical protein
VYVESRHVLYAERLGLHGLHLLPTVPGRPEVRRIGLTCDN